MAGGVDTPDGSAAERIFLAVLDLPSSERTAYLDRACESDCQLRQRVEALLRAHDAPEGFLPEQPGDPPVEGSSLTNFLAAQLTEKPGDTIGRYKLRQKLGEGGCGVVYLADQEEPVRRKVALKIIKLGMDTRQVVARFEAERQALALMEHPNIARVIDAGATETGRPYFVMELVGGIKITDYCEQNDLTTRQRLDLFIQVCRAIQHAHQKGIIHRDIKPSNVLVTMQDGVALPKVIDFGIAKATQGRLTNQTVFTAFEQFLGTPAYMSPEQAQLGSPDVDTRSDIYSLGVLLYELLTGKTPFDAKDLLAAGLEVMRRTIQETDPPTPSARLKQELANTKAESRKQKAEITARDLVKLLAGDLDWIVMKCLEKDRARRYDTANGLATDIERHLRDEPVAASPPSRLYRLQKLARRNKLAFIAGTSILASLVIGLGFSTWSLHRERKAKEEQVRLRQQAEANESRAQANEKKAEREREKSEQVARLFKETLSEVSPYKAFGRDRSTLQYILDKAAERITRDFTNQPAVEAELYYTLGNAYYEMKDLEKAEMMHRKALETRRKLAPGGDLDVAASLCRLTAVVNWKPNREEAFQLSREAVGITRRLAGSDQPALARALFWHGSALWSVGKWAESEGAFREALQIQRKWLPERDPELARTLLGLAYALVVLGETGDVEAEANYLEAIPIVKQAYGEEHPLVADALERFGLFCRFHGRSAEAESLHYQTLTMRRKVLGNDHPALGQSLENLGDALSDQGKLPEAEKLWRELLTHRHDPSWGEYTKRALRKELRKLRRENRQAEAQALLEDEFEHANPSGLNDVALFLETSIHLEAGDGADEIRFAEKAASQSGRKEASILDTLAAAYARAGDFDKATNVQKEAIMQEHEENAKKGLESTLKLYELGCSFSRARDLNRGGQVEDARALVDCIIEYAPALTLTVFTWRLAVSPDARKDDLLTAVRFAEKAVALTGRTNADYLDALAAARASAGDFPKAVALQKEALALLKDTEPKSFFESRVRLYESNSPFRE